ncbi:hypothetical protein G6F70_007257 [Rhizopus microsporus]|uniref:Reverse transcriptase zinc-binding domain-containing protein n=1 Tax=Rhizopus microsporus TaxID=58291 RepID=A0A1X0RMN8_RHIZD|nr:hypothetical protein G6F71_006778 [Rhizopus microsporus]KAG1196667.1 hypothetical protein G6F70_007257 [Rhizopus microsporus]KAG1208450.1 hypothetical protein G6F69_007206 [Rhizopus microsporus]KAG1229781.1 hypothetical protein G6F67_006911 [Rhizopus microsporus]KAG1264830.1 hypothetical protein G6F68_004057 [Rhizopus microsporus]
MAFTPWFRLLHDCIPTAALQHAWNHSVAASPLCRLYQQNTESSFHLFISCSLKLNFWFSIFERYSLLGKLLTAGEIWSVLISFVPVDKQAIADTDALCFFGAGISRVWKCH